MRKRKRRSFTAEFKQEAVRLCEVGDRSDVCEIGAAVERGSASASERSVDLVVSGSGPSAIVESIRDRLTAGTIFSPRSRPHSRLRLRFGTRENGEPLEAEIRGRNVLFAGDPQSGKSWFVGQLCELLILRRYAVCILDPEGDYSCLGQLPGVIVYRVRENEDPVSNLEGILRQPALSVVVDLSGLPTGAKAPTVRSVLRSINSVRHAFGVPHRIVLDEAHYFLDRHADAAIFDPELGGFYLATYRSPDLDGVVLDACDVIVATKIADRRLAARLLGVAYPTEPPSEWLDTMTNLNMGEAVLLRASSEYEDGIVRFRFEPRITAHVRHRKKYADVGVPPGHEFAFTEGGHATEHRARTLREFLQLVPRVSDHVFHRHLVRGDFHRWIEDVVGDRDLGGVIRSLEHSNATTARETIVRAIRDRYFGAEPEPDRRRSSGGAVRRGSVVKEGTRP